MGWANCGTDSKGRPIGYAHAATCDQEGCEAAIDRGLSYACGGCHLDGEDFCEDYFCDKHLIWCTDNKVRCPGCAAAFELTHPDPEAEEAGVPS